MKKLFLVSMVICLMVGSLIFLSSKESAQADTAKPAVARDYWGALAFSDTTHKFGWAVNYTSENGASERALEECPSDDCEVVLTFANSCGAYAASPDDSHWGWAIGDDRQDAQAKALAQCNKRGGNCKIRVWGCSTGNN